jgi:hypothetical protein
MDEQTPRTPAQDDRPEAPTTEYAANQEPGGDPVGGDVGGDGPDLETASDLDPHEPPGQG